MNITYQIIRSDRKTVSIQIGSGGDVVVRCPTNMKTEDVRRFVKSKESWLQKHLAKMQGRTAASFSLEQMEVLRQQARELVTKRVEYYAPIVGVNYGRIAIRAQHTRWGSCSSKGNLNFNCLLALLPPAVLDYVVVHELCHRKELNHSARFWAEVERVLPDYR